MRRLPAVAGLFYPRDGDDLRAALDEAFADARPSEPLRPKALVAPHAGYVYSGPIAASAYSTILPDHGIERVVLLGPSHYVAFQGLALPEADAFVTPMGEVPIDGACRARLQGFRQVIVSDLPHEREHSLEVQLPFLQRVLDGFALVPLAVGFAEPEQVAEILDAEWGTGSTLVVISTDLSHYLDAATARAADERTAEAVSALDEEGIGDHDACGARGLRGMLNAARSHGLRARTLDLRNSSDTAGDPSRVVGYGAFAFHG